jgi:glycosyltransferase involved in cell wall biosynthesis
MISVIIATYGEDHWEELARERALPSAELQAEDIVIGHDPDATIAQVRNALAAEAQGNWLCFLDADDELAPGFVTAMERRIATTTFSRERHALYTPIVQQVVRGRPRNPSFYPEVNLMMGNWLIVGTVVEADLFRQVGGFGEYPHGFEDWSLWFKCVKSGARVFRVQNAVYIQHVNPRSKHRLGWRDRRWQVETHLRVQAELEAWAP